VQKPIKKRAGGVAHGVDPEFKVSVLQKRKKEKKRNVSLDK
jgi:hypothetical protein